MIGTHLKSINLLLKSNLNKIKTYLLSIGMLNDSIPMVQLLHMASFCRFNVGEIQQPRETHKSKEQVNHLPVCALSIYRTVDHIGAKFVFYNIGARLKRNTTHNKFFNISLIIFRNSLISL